MPRRDCHRRCPMIALTVHTGGRGPVRPPEPTPPPASPAPPLTPEQMAEAERITRHTLSENPALLAFFHGFLRGARDTDADGVASILAVLRGSWRTDAPLAAIIAHWPALRG